MGERTLSHIAYLSETIGSRVSGTEGEQRAVDYIRREFERSGYSVDQYAFDFDGIGVGSVTIEGGEVSSEATVLGGSGSSDVTPLQQAAESRQAITVEARTRITSVDVIARTAPGDRCRIVVGAHHDTVSGVPGATDNASGTAMTLELSRALAADGLDEGLCFVTFGGEESGLFGSRELVNHWKRLGSLPEFMVNLDVVGTGTEAMLIGDAGLIRTAEALASRVEMKVFRSQMPVGTASGHASFADAGVTALLISSDDFSEIDIPGGLVGRDRRTCPGGHRRPGVRTGPRASGPCCPAVIPHLA